MRHIFFLLIVINLAFFCWKFLVSTETSTPTTSAAPSPHLAISSISLAPEPTEISVIAGETTPLKTPTSIVQEAGTEASVELDVSASEPSTNVNNAVAKTEELPAVACRQSPWTADSELLAIWHKALAGASVQEQQRQVETGTSYLVMIPALATKEDTLVRLRALKDLPIESAFLNKGEQEGGISLGLFSKAESAQGRLAQVKAAGVDDAVLQERKKSQQEVRLLAGLTLWPESLQGWALATCTDNGAESKPGAQPF